VSRCAYADQERAALPKKLGKQESGRGENPLVRLGDQAQGMIPIKSTFVFGGKNKKKTERSYNGKGDEESTSRMR